MIFENVAVSDENFEERQQIDTSPRDQKFSSLGSGIALRATLIWKRSAATQDFKSKTQCSNRIAKGYLRADQLR